MTPCRNRNTLPAWCLTASMAASLVSCGVAVPTLPDVEIARTRLVQIEDGAMVTVGPRRLLETVSGELTDAYPDIELVDALLFRDTAFPDGGWELETLLEPGTCRTVGEKLDVDYLVLTGAMKADQGEEEGFLMPLLIGAMEVEGSSTISAVIMDMKTEKLVYRVTCKATGTSRGVYYVIFIVGNAPLTESGATKGLAREIGKVITELSPAGKPRVAVLALEFPGKREAEDRDQ